MMILGLLFSEPAVTYQLNTALSSEDSYVPSKNSKIYSLLRNQFVNEILLKIIY